MFSIRRYVVYFGTAVLVLIILNRINNEAITSSGIGYGSLIPGYRNSFQNGLDWAKVPVNFPVRNLASLPAGIPKQLPRVQYDFKDDSSRILAKRKERRAAVEAVFLRSWKAYKKHAWMKDELSPITGAYSNPFGGWAASLVDNLDNLWIMGMKDEFEEAVTSAIQIDLSTATTEIIKVFETNIRHLGGLLSAYDLSKDKRLLDKAMEFGEMLLKAFDTPNRMPITRWNPREGLRGKQEAPFSILLAEIGSFSMEFTHLSQLTGDMRWYDAINRITQVLADQQEKTHLPGMWGLTVNAQELDFTIDVSFTLSAMSDSTYEYLPKMYALLGGLEPIYANMYSRSAETAIKNLIWKPMTPDHADIYMSGYLRTSSYFKRRPQVEPQGQHLVCFAGGMFALGGRLFSEEDQVRVGKKLTDGCIWTYRAFPMGIMPEVYHMVACESRIGDCPWNETKWKDEMKERNGNVLEADELIDSLRIPKGFTAIDDPRYMLRPEAIESVFILYRITGEEYLLDAAWDMFNSIIKATTTELAYAALADVTIDQATLNAKGANVKMNSMESFWMAETLKYFYLIFSEPDVINLDEWVFNTEAHPFGRPSPGQRLKL